MKLASVGQVGIGALRQQLLDLSIVASGFESRCTNLTRLTDPSATHKLCLGFQEFSDHPRRKKSDHFFRARGYEEALFPGHASGRVAESLCAMLSRIDKDDASVLVDISSMTRTWYGGIVHGLRHGSIRQRCVKVYFGYTPAAYTVRSEPYPQNRYVGPVRGFTGLTLPTKPAALIVGLGQDRGRALGMQAEVDPGITASFIASPGTDKRYEAAVRRVNAQFLSSIPGSLRFEYPLLDFPTTYYRLRDVASVLADKWQVVMAALGPKLFALICFLTACQVPALSVWRVSAGERLRPTDRRPGRSIVLGYTEWRQPAA